MPKEQTAAPAIVWVSRASRNATALIERRSQPFAICVISVAE